MRISFCDLCNESIPLTDFERGKAQRRKGRAICARCESAMHGGPEGAEAGAGDSFSSPKAPGSRAAVASSKRPEEAQVASASVSTGPVLALPAAAPARGSSLGTVLAVVALIFACGAAVFLLDRIEAVRRDQAGLRAGLASDLDLVERTLEARFDARGEAALATAERADTLALRLMARLDEAEGAGDEERSALRQDLAVLRGTVGELRRALDARTAVGSSAASRTVPSQESAAQAVNPSPSQTKTGDTDADEGASAGGVDQNSEPVGETGSERLELPEPVVIEAEPPAWWPHVRDLSDENSGRRWGAVQALGKTGDPAVIEHVVPKLKDSDLFVRLAAARVLGDLRAVIAVGHLIDALEDKAPSVREQVAVSLRTITGENHRFVHDAPTRERGKRIKAWRDWWDRHRARLLGESSGS